jgi:hypothetical protein
MQHEHIVFDRQELIDIIYSITKKDRGAFIDYDHEAVKNNKYPVKVVTNIKIANVIKRG